MSLQLIIQTLVLPLCLSLLLFLVKPYQKTLNTISLLLIWSLSYFWIMGLSVVIPSEALDWLWLSSITILVISFVKYNLLKQILTATIFITSLIIFSWPVLKYPLNVSIIIDILLTTIAATIIIFRTELILEKSSNNSAIIIFISTSSLAIVVGLSSSILIAQLNIALAATLMGVVLLELGEKIERYLNQTQLIISLNIYLALLFTARIYAELPFSAFILLALSPLTIVFIPRQFNWVVSLLFGIGAVLWILITSDMQEYY